MWIQEMTAHVSTTITLVKPEGGLLYRTYRVDVHDKEVVAEAAQRDLLEMVQVHLVLQGQCFGV